MTFATQSAGCEEVAQLDAPLLMFHGDRDEILPADTSRVVQMMAGKGEVVICEGDGHLLDKAATEIRGRLYEWIPSTFESHAAGAHATQH